MAGYVFLGRQRHPLKMLLFQLLTLGVYGRVYLYKILRDFDGHEALFLDRRPYIPLLVLPFVGPLLVKRKVNVILGDLLHHDVTTPRYQPRKLSALAWVPLVPFYHMELQRLLNHHWNLHRKELELDLKRSHLAALQRSRAEEAAKAAQALAKEIARREKELEDVRQAALALREAELVRQEAEREAGRKARKSPMALVRKLSAAAAARLPRRGAGATAEEDTDTHSSDDAEETAPARKGKAFEEPAASEENEPAASSEPIGEPEPPESLPEKRKGGKATQPGDTPSESPRKDWRSLLRFLPGRKGDASEPEPASRAKKAKPSAKRAAAEKETKLSRAERKELKRKAKEKAKEAKRAAKEKKKADKLAAKEKKRAAKEAAKAAKQKEKESKKEAKAKAKAERERAKADEKKKTTGDKKPKPAAKKAKGKPAKAKSRLK